MSLNTVRNYLAERFQHLKQEWKNYSRNDELTALPSLDATDEDLRRTFLRARNKHEEHDLTELYRHNAQQQFDAFIIADTLKSEPYEFYTHINPTDVPENRQPRPGILLLPFKYHKTNPVYPTDAVPESGFQLDPLIMDLLINKYPQYLKHVNKYVRPLGTTDATFDDFNREQHYIEPLSDDRKSRCLSLVKHFLDVTPYQPIHFVDTQYTKSPLSTGTGYFHRHSYKIRTHAKFARHEDYALRPTSKGYFINSFLEYSRTIVHHIKTFQYPFNIMDLEFPEAETRLRIFLLQHPTILFTRNHISDRDGNLKQRPVYAVDDLFLLMETMLTFPLLIMARKMSCSIMYGLETIRGGNHYLDCLAKRYKSFFTIDWSHFDQTMPRVITDLYYTDFLESLIIINHGYQPTHEYPTYPDLTPTKMFDRMSNLLQFIHTWYNNMVFLTADGYSYLRTHAGVPSGLYNTQYLDSFCNLYLITDGLIEFGFSDHEIKRLTLFIMGDDNSGFTPWQIGLLHKFITWFESYAFYRYKMVLSKSKSVITMMRNRIETLSYTCNFGMPTRPLPKLVAQLCYPEHGPNRKYMSARAIGIAYAAAGMNPTFHNLCKDVYHTFLPYSADPSSDTLEKIIKHLPGQFKMLDAYTDVVNLTRFPTLHDVRSQYQKWNGPLDYSPKWNTAHFEHTPEITPPDAMTMLEYRLKHDIPRNEVNEIFEA